MDSLGSSGLRRMQINIPILGVIISRLISTTTTTTTTIIII
jgi:hypothetical protein